MNKEKQKEDVDMQTRTLERIGVTYVLLEEKDSTSDQIVLERIWQL